MSTKRADLDGVVGSFITAASSDGLNLDEDANGLLSANVTALSASSLGSTGSSANAPNNLYEFENGSPFNMTAPKAEPILQNLKEIDGLAAQEGSCAISPSTACDLSQLTGTIASELQAADDVPTDPESVSHTGRSGSRSSPPTTER